jgi:type VI secretion system protein ImpK
VSDDAEKEFGDAGQEPAPNSADTRADDERAYPSRPFRSWSSAQDEDKAPTLWTRISGVFRRSASLPKTDGTEPVVEAAFESIEEALPTNQGAGDIPLIELRAPRQSGDAFTSVDDTLPSIDERFAPPSPPTVRPELAETLDPIDATPAPYFGDETPVADEIDEDTDEFEIAALGETQPIAPPVPGVDDETAQVSRKSLLARLVFWRDKSKAKAGAPAMVVESNPVFLFSKFRTFYNEIIRYKHKKTEYTAGFSTAIIADVSSDQNPDSVAEATSKHLSEMLELQAAEAMWMGGESAARYPDAQYAMAALADETFLNMEWEGQAGWHKHLLETRIFRTRSADVELFRRIDALLKEQPSSAAGKDLARVYLMVIAAGFRGKYRQFGLTRALAEYRQRLYEYIHNGDALMLYAPDRRIFPGAAANTLEGHAVSRFSAAQRWAAILVFLVVSYTAIAHMAWTRVSADLKDVTDRIKTGSTVTGTR